MGSSVFHLGLQTPLWAPPLSTQNLKLPWGVGTWAGAGAEGPGPRFQDREHWR